MDTALKNRLIGAAVLLLLAVVFLPMLFDGANEQALLADMRMPAAPEVPSAEALLAESAPRLAEAAPAIDALHTQAAAEGEVIAPVVAAPPVPEPPVAPVATAPATAPAVPVAAVGTAGEPVRLAAITEGWDVQVAAVASADGAAALLRKLRAAGYKARVLAVTSNGRLLHRVLVGPEIRREDALALRDRLAADAAVGKPSGLLVRYVP